MRVSIWALVLAVLISGQSYSADDTEKSVSPVLIAEFKVVMADVFKLMKADRRLPHDLSDAEIKKKVDSATTAYQKLQIFDATAEEAKAFAAQKFDDAKNTQKLKEMLDFLKSTNIEMPTTTVYAMNQLKSGDLKGARLELCVRLVEFNVGTLKQLDVKR